MSRRLSPGAAGALGAGIAVCAIVASLLLTFAFAFVTKAAAAPAGPLWTVSQDAYPSPLVPGDDGNIVVTVENTGVTPSTGVISVTDELPPGVVATGGGDGFIWDCPGAAGATVVTCSTIEANYPSVGARSKVPALTIPVAVDPGANGTQAGRATVSGGGSAAARSVTTSTAFSSSPPKFGVHTFTGQVVDALGERGTQAGAHADFSTTIAFDTKIDTGDILVPTDNVKRIHVELPAGVVGNPSATPKCTSTQLRGNGALGAPDCPAETQVGVVDLGLMLFGTVPLPADDTPVFNIVPPPGVPAQFAFNLFGVIVPINATVRPGGDYALIADISNISQSLAVVSTRLTLWGVPADTSHDAKRRNPVDGSLGVRSTSTRLPFMTAPGSCPARPFVTQMSASSWQSPNDVATASFDTDVNGEPIVTTGCELLPFDPTFTIKPDSPARRGKPAGFTVDLGVPQNQNPDGLASANVKTVKVTFPEGMVVSASSAQGLASCSPADVGLNNSDAPRCLNGSKIGSAEIVTPLLDEPLTGAVYLASQRDNPFGTTLAVYLVAQGSGVTLKLPGRIDPDPKTGRIVATFDDNPQLPFSTLSLHFKTGEGAPLSLPTTCGPATSTAVLTPWSGSAPVSIDTSFNVSYDGNGAPCPPLGFAPKFVAGTANPVGGKDSPLTVGFTRTDDDQQFSGLTVNMPRGLLARISSTTLCADGAANAGTCGADSRIGSVTTAAGAGANPFTLPGQVYITGPYKGAPFGLSIVVPAVAGPFNLGTVVVRAAIYLDRNTAELRIVSDPLPTILEGIPLQIRLVEVKVDRPGFTFNPTNCTASRIGGVLSSVAGAIANVSSRFQVGDCAALPFAPKLSIKVGARGKLTRGKRTPLDVTLSMSRGQANNRSVQVTLPKTINARLDVVNRRVACTAAQYAADRCPNPVGTATAVTPLLRDPLKGPAYFVYNPARRLPDLVVRLSGQVKFDLVGKVTITRDLKLQTTFDTVPDVPISTFRLSLLSGGRNGPVGLTRNICLRAVRKALKADLAITAQNNKKIARQQTLTVAGCARASTRRSASRRASRRAARK